MTMNDVLKLVLDHTLAFAEKHPGEVPPILEQAVVAAYRNGLVDAARVCQDQMRQHRTTAERAETGTVNQTDAEAAGRASFECAQLVLDCVITVETALRTFP